MRFMQTVQQCIIVNIVQLINVKLNLFLIVVKYFFEEKQQRSDAQFDNCLRQSVWILKVGFNLKFLVVSK